MQNREPPAHPALVSLGMLVLDELRWPDRPPLVDVPGGSGAFAVLGARLVAGRVRAREVGCFILAGNDFPDSALRYFRDWGVDLVVKTEAQRPSTRGLLEYLDTTFGRKTFRYTTTPLQPSPSDLPPHFLNSSSLHLLAPPDQLIKHVECLSSLRSPQPILVWEPLPPKCSTQTKDSHLLAARSVDVFSPNHLELLSLFYDGSCERSETTDKAEGGRKKDSVTLDKNRIESCVDIFLDSGIGPSRQGTIVVRAGEHGCLVAGEEEGGRGRYYRWLPAFEGDNWVVVDATGAGNTFLGGLSFAMGALGKSVLEAAAFATVAASFAVEQVGMPVLGTDGERWNDARFEDRYASYRRTAFGGTN